MHIVFVLLACLRLFSAITISVSTNTYYDHYIDHSPGAAKFGGSLGRDGGSPSRHYNRRSGREGKRGRVVPAFVEGSKHSTTALPVRETQIHHPRMVSRRWSLMHILSPSPRYNLSWCTYTCAVIFA